MKKKLFLAVAALAIGTMAMGAKTASQLRVYINPGHGSWGGGDRPMNILREVNGALTTVYPNTSYASGVKPDTTAFFESNTNLWKCLAMADKLKQYGLTMSSLPATNLKNNISMSRVKSGPYPTNPDNTTYNKNLSAICAEANANNYDMFVSVHSNAYDGVSQNYLVFFFAGTTSNVEHNAGSKKMAQTAFPYLYSIKHQGWQAVHNNGIGVGVRNDESVYSSGYGVLNHKVPGYLVEGYFHTYQPSKQRAMQPLADRIEGYMYARGLAEYFGIAKESTGDIYGVVRQKDKKFSHSLYTPNSTRFANKEANPDVYLPLNGVTCILKKNGVEVKRLKTDNHYNGAFVFTDIAPGTYTVEFSKAGYKTTTETYTVTAANTVFPDAWMEEGEPNTIKGTPLNSMTEKWNISEKRGTLNSKGYDASKIRNFCYKDGKLYCVYNHSQIMVLNAQTGDLLGYLSNGDGVVDGGTLKLCDVKTIDGKIIACNLAIAANNEILHFYCWDDDNAEPQLIKTVSDLRGAARIGDCMELSGSFDGDMYLTFANDDNTTTRIIEFWRLGGANWNGKAYPVLTADGSQRLATSMTTRCYKRNGGWWIDGFNSYPTFVTLNSSNNAIAQYSMASSTKTWGTGFNEFDWKGDHYTANMVFNENPATSADNYKGGRVRLAVNNVGYNNPIVVADYPKDGLGETTKNGNVTASSWVNTDGKNYLELWVNSTGQGIAYFTQGTPPTHTVEPITPNAVGLSVNPTSLDFTAQTDSQSDATISVTGRNLKADIKAALSGANASMFSINKNTIAKADGQGSITITYAPTQAGTHTATLTLSTTEANNVTVALKGIATDPVTFEPNISTMTEGWVYSATKGNQGAASWLEINSANVYTRDIEVLNGKLYAVNAKPWNTSPSIAVVDAYTGNATGTLNITGIATSGVRCSIGGLTKLGGKLIATPSVNANHTLTFYKWDNINGAPVVWGTDATHGEIVVGDQVNASGDMTSGALWFSDGTKVLKYTVTNGNLNTTPTVITLASSVGTMNGSCDVVPVADGTFWVVGKDCYPTRFDATGKKVEEITTLAPSAAQVQGMNKAVTLGKTPKSGTSATVVPFGDKTYMAAITYLGASENMTGGAISVLDITNGADKARLVGVYPEAGLGGTMNGQFQTSVTHELTDDGTTLHLWGQVPYQGAAYYSYKGNVPTGVNNVSANDDALNINVFGNVISTDADASLQVYNVSGLMMAAAGEGDVIYLSQLPKGIYIVRAVAANGAQATRKIAVK